ncbi:MAG: hypothetical protein RL653_4341, partial [Pseudomonadota bacterium]
MVLRPAEAPSVKNRGTHCPMTSPFSRLLLLCVLTCSTLASAQQAGALEGKRLAVLEFTNTTGRDLASLGTLSDEARGAVLDAAGPHGALILTRENMLEVTKATGGNCKEGECEVETARNLGVFAFVSGAISLVDDEYFLTLKVYDTRSGSLLGQRLLQAKKEGELIARIRTETHALVQQALGPSARSRASGRTGVVGQVNAAGSFEVQDEETVIAAFESTPPGAVVMLDGKLLCQSTPCSRPVSPGVHVLSLSREEYDEARNSITVSATQKKFSLALPPAFATLSVKTVPEGLGLTLDGKPLEQSEVQGRHLSPGNHELLIRDACHEATGERFNVSKGETKSVVLTAAPRMAGLKVESVDGQGNAVEGEIWAGDTKLGAIWKALKVPLCSTGLHVRTASGARTNLDVKLVEKQVTNLQVLAGLPAKDFVRMLETDFGNPYIDVPNPDVRRARYRKECAAGEVVACALQGMPQLPLRTWTGIDGQKLLRACSAGQLAACAPAVRVLAKKSPSAAYSNDASDVAGAYRAATTGCTSGDMLSCVRKGVLVEYGIGAKKDPAGAVALYKQSCDAGNAGGCFALGTMYVSGKGIPKDEARAAALYKQACEAGNANGCSNLGVMYDNGKGVPKDEARATALYKQACDGGNFAGCNILGISYANGQGVPKDEARAATLYKQACDGGDFSGCNNL